MPVHAMTYAAKIEATPPAPRAKGGLRLTARRRGAESVIKDLRQEGSLKALFPQVRGAALDAVFLNTAGGLTGGDRMQIAITAEAGARTVVSSQAAERAYRAQPGQVARVGVSLDVAAGGRVDWLPQETILYDEAALSRRMELRLRGDATALVVEPVIFGRVAMGETVGSLQFSDQWRVWRDGKLVFADALRMQGDAATALARKAVGCGAGAMATVLLAAPNALAFTDFPALGPHSAANLIDDDLLLLRILADDGFALRQQLIPVIETLTDLALPRVWRL